VQFERLHENEKPQGEQSAWQKDRSSAQFKSQGQAGHNVVAPSQVTEPRWPPPQLLFTPEQVLPEQLTVLPSQQFAWQNAFSNPLGRFAAGSGAGVPTGAAREARNA
jgi:hypothetical protein